MLRLCWGGVHAVAAPDSAAPKMVETSSWDEIAGQQQASSAESVLKRLHALGENWHRDKAMLQSWTHSSSLQYLGMAKNRAYFFWALISWSGWYLILDLVMFFSLFKDYVEFRGSYQNKTGFSLADIFRLNFGWFPLLLDLATLYRIENQFIRDKTTKIF